MLIWCQLAGLLLLFSTKTVALLNQINWEVRDNNDCETLNKECKAFTFDISKFLSGLFLLLNSVAPALPGLVLLWYLSGGQIDAVAWFMSDLVIYVSPRWILEGAFYRVTFFVVEDTNENRREEESVQKDFESEEKVACLGAMVSVMETSWKGSWMTPFFDHLLFTQLVTMMKTYWKERGLGWPPSLVLDDPLLYIAEKGFLHRN